MSTLESNIAALEKEIKAIDHDLLMDYDSAIAKPNFFDSYQTKKKKLEKLMENWELLSTEIEAIA